MNERTGDAVARPDRMPLLPDRRLTPQQRHAADQVRTGPRGELSGPFVPLLYSPAALSPLQELGSYLRFESTLPRAVFELAVLMTAHSNDQPYEWAFHKPLARAAGLSPAAIDAISRGQQPDDLDIDQLAAFAVVAELLQTRRVSDRRYRDALTLLGEQGVIDLVVTIGYYTTLALVMNTAQTPAPTVDDDPATTDSKAVR
ncbi:carboxymuconolactone decarboxylase family protein [Nocardia asteroides]|uniref:carboxymuconolactone decarboxylase family protein n=1 Tax=Nocardia asteroides TaxID=1824 RepID=UPI00343E97C2